MFLAVATVGGVLADDRFPSDLLYDNLMIEANIIEASHRNDVGKLLFLVSSCIYPKHANQPIVEDALLTGPLEPTNQWYAVAKIARIKLAQAYLRQHGRDYISIMPSHGIRRSDYAKGGRRLCGICGGTRNVNARDDAGCEGRSVEAGKGSKNA